MKILYVTPHLSTGGLPQYLTKKIESLIDEHEIHVVEYDNISCDFVVQRNKILNLIGDKLITLDQNTHYQLTAYIQNKSFDIVHFEEFSESFIDFEILKGVYNSNRTYKILETTHGSHEQKKVFLPDAFVFVSQAHIEMYSKYNVPSHIVEYPIEKNQKSPRTEALAKLGLDPNKKHVLNVGLFTPGKNQGEIFEYAKHLPDHQFHFVGNQAGNFEFYWGDLMKNKPDNCIVWGERNDVELFYDAADIFLFTSKFELNPLVIKEALCWNLPILMYDLPIYNNHFDMYENITYLSSDINTNISLIKGDPLDTTGEIVVITAYPNTPEKEALLIELINNVKSFGYDIMISSHYNVPEHIQNMVQYNVIDLTDNVLYRNEFHEYNSSSFYWTSNNNRKIIEVFHFNHSYAVWTLWQNAINKLVDTQYKKIHIVDYDCIISDKRYFEHHSNILNTNDLIVYSDPEYYITNLFSFNMCEVFHRCFNEYDSKKSFFNNSFGEHILEQFLYKTVKKYGIKHINLKRSDITRFNTKFDMARAEAIKPDLLAPYFTINLFQYSETKDILLLSNNMVNLIVDGKVYEPCLAEKLYMIDKKDEHTYSYIDIQNGQLSEYKVDMIEYSKYHKIEVLNSEILIDQTNHNDIVVVTAHIDSSKKEEILVNLINNLKILNYHILLTSHHPIPEYICDKVEYTVIDSDNELLYRQDYDKYNVDVHLYNVNGNRKLKKVALYNHGYAVWTLWKNAHTFLTNSGYEKIHIVDYDTEMVDKQFLNRACNLLDNADFVVYKSDDCYTNERYVTSLFSYNKSQNIFNYFNTKDDYFRNEFSTTLLEDIFYKVLSKKQLKVSVLDQKNIMDFNTKINLVVGDNSAVNELSTDKYTLNLYFYNDKYDILYLANCQQSILVDNNRYTNPGSEKFYLIPKKNEHTIDDYVNVRVVNMLDHGKFNTIEIYNQTILIPYEKQKIRIVHMVTEPDTNIREKESIASIKSFADSFDNIQYHIKIGEIYTGLPPAENCANPDWIAMEPGNQKLSPGHYGCYLAHKNAISIPDNNQYDMVIIFEGDAIITTDHQTLYDNLLRWKNIADDENMNLVGFGNVYFDTSSNERDDLYLNVHTFIPAHAYFVTKNSVPVVVNAYNTTKWQATDLWMTNVSGLRKAITKTIHSQQVSGYSLIDKKIKNKENDLNQIYSN